MKRPSQKMTRSKKKEDTKCYAFCELIDLSTSQRSTTLQKIRPPIMYPHMLTQVPAPPPLYPATQAAHTYGGCVPHIEGEGSISLLGRRVCAPVFPTNSPELILQLLWESTVAPTPFLQGL